MNFSVAAVQSAEVINNPSAYSGAVMWRDPYISTYGNVKVFLDLDKFTLWSNCVKWNTWDMLMKSFLL